MTKKSWKGEPIDVVRMAYGKLTTIDNTRVLAARQARINVHAIIHESNKSIPVEMAKRFLYRTTYPNGSNIIGWDGS
ncbi:hypothetical protein H8B09_19390 [Paenibacillus sp. PR3]|uniref:Uncharacterized protein n=1 Tax=Paenibacillus terricola TaxID=2763503 RepID=A0ABR8N2B8_9BACL|nr:hypothetical protein [Paenibacillus terricola]MBD3920939.1 hypothetical protein [Paenibacillus terricola]